MGKEIGRSLGMTIFIESAWSSKKCDGPQHTNCPTAQAINAWLKENRLDDFCGRELFASVGKQQAHICVYSPQASVESEAPMAIMSAQMSVNHCLWIDRYDTGVLSTTEQAVWFRMMFIRTAGFYAIRDKFEAMSGVAT